MLKPARAINVRDMNFPLCFWHPDGVLEHIPFAAADNCKHAVASEERRLVLELVAGPEHPPDDAEADAQE
jgi:hypothetical protein